LAVLTVARVAEVLIPTDLTDLFYSIRGRLINLPSSASAKTMESLFDDRELPDWAVGPRIWPKDKQLNGGREEQ
jgi:hypothetical protein